jgi:hypothetical protein
MRPWEFTLAELTGGKDPDPNAGNPFFKQPFEEFSIVPITDRPRFATAMLKGASMAHQVLLVREGEGWRCIGHWVDDTITIDPEFERQGLALELVLRTVEHRNGLPLSSNFTQDGYNLIKRAHKRSVEAALKCGLDVPQKVFDENPSYRI